MKFLLDAQLPLRLSKELNAAGHDAIHTSSLPSGNKTPDSEITALAFADQRVIVTKDGDFVTAFLLGGSPPKLLLVSTGNISNEELSRLFKANLNVITEALASNDFVELGRHAVIVHR